MKTLSQIPIGLVAAFAFSILFTGELSAKVPCANHRINSNTATKAALRAQQQTSHRVTSRQVKRTPKTTVASQAKKTSSTKTTGAAARKPSAANTASVKSPLTTSTPDVDSTPEKDTTPKKVENPAPIESDEEKERDPLPLFPNNSPIIGGFVPLHHDALATGTGPGSPFIVNALIHILATVFLFLLLRNLLGRRAILAAILPTILFACHPFQFAALHNGIIGLHAGIGSLFALLAIFLYMTGFHSRRVAVEHIHPAPCLGAIASLVVAIVANPLFIVLPLILGLFETIHFGNRGNILARAPFLRLLPFLVVALLSGGLLFGTGHHGEHLFRLNFAHPTLLLVLPLVLALILRRFRLNLRLRPATLGLAFLGLILPLLFLTMGMPFSLPHHRLNLLLPGFTMGIGILAVFLFAVMLTRRRRLLSAMA